MIDKTIALPEGFHRAQGSGLILPNNLERHALADDEVKLLKRATAIANRLGWYLTFTCGHDRCRANLETAVAKHVDVVGGFEMQCGHQVVRCVSYKKPRRR